jgi:hypothetical protein
MRTLLTVVVVFTILTTVTILTIPATGKDAYALCSEVKDPNVSCHEQYNTRSNIDSTTSSSVEEGDDTAPLLCSDLKCNLGHEYMLDPDNDLVEDPLDFMDY